MTRKRKSNPNMMIMAGVIAMSLTVLTVAVLFWLWCFPDGTGAAQKADYQLAITNEEPGDSLLLVVDDSVVYTGKASADSLLLTVSTPDGDHMLMVARPDRDVANSFDLPRGGGRLSLHIHDDAVDMKAE